jgi:hypothetical protein
MSSLKLKLYHEEVMQEEGIKLSELPDEIQRKIKGFNLMKKKWEKDPEEEREEREFIQLQKQSIKIGDMIIDFIENDFDEEEDEEEDEEKKPVKKEKKEEKEEEDEEDEEEDEEKKPVKKEGLNKKQKENVDKKTPKSGNFGNLMMEKKILSIMEARGDKRIRISDLEAIIGREPDYPEQKVNNIILRKVFLASDYRLL